jgi:hypothetical protein
MPMRPFSSSVILACGNTPPQLRAPAKKSSGRNAATIAAVSVIP